MMRRHALPAILLHWFNAFCWLFLLFSGFALLAEHAQPIGAWWRASWGQLFGARGLLLAHIWVGAVWIAVYAICGVVFAKSVTLPFLRAVFVRPGRDDLRWCAKKALWLTIGPKKMAALGCDPALPPQGFYNAGQRMVAVLAVLASLGLAASGVILAFWSGSFSELALQYTLLAHFCCAAVMAVFLPVHIYMAALAPGEGPALRSMFTGHVPREFARRHNPLWARDNGERTP